MICYVNTWFLERRCRGVLTGLVQPYPTTIIYSYNFQNLNHDSSPCHWLAHRIEHKPSSCRVQCIGTISTAEVGESLAGFGSASKWLPRPSWRCISRRAGYWLGTTTEHLRILLLRLRDQPARCSSTGVCGIELGTTSRRLLAIDLLLNCSGISA